MSTRMRGLETVSRGGQGRNGELDPGVDESSLQSICTSSVCNRQLILSRGSLIPSFICSAFTTAKYVLGCVKHDGHQRHVISWET